MLFSEKRLAFTGMSFELGMTYQDLVQELIRRRLNTILYPYSGHLAVRVVFLRMVFWTSFRPL
jgi:hypothetical protein